MYYGCDLFTLTNAYATLARNGVYIPTKFIDSINTKKMTIYQNKTEKTTSISPETAYQLTLALQDCSKSGTGKKLNKFGQYVACKTGTNGTMSSTENTDAYNISYSTDYTVCVWIGANTNNLLPANYNGGNHPSIIAKLIWEKLAPSNEFLEPQNIVEKNIDKISYDKNGQIKLADNNAPERYTIKAKFNKKYMPTETSTLFSNPKTPLLKAKKINNTIELSFESEMYYEYDILKCVDNNVELISNIKNKSGNQIITDSIPNVSTHVTYYIVLKTPKGAKTMSNEVKVLT